MKAMEKLTRCCDTRLMTFHRCKSWIWKKQVRNNIEIFKLWCWRRLLRLLYTAMKTNECVIEKKSILTLGIKNQLQKIIFWSHYRKIKLPLEDHNAGKSWRENCKRWMDSFTIPVNVSLRKLKGYIYGIF